MKAQIATATRIIDSPAEITYQLLADYRNGHPRILPKDYFLSLEVEEGGYGEGTIVNFKMRLLGQTQSFRSYITEPVPGRQLVETDIHTEISTTFLVIPTGNDKQSRVTISTELKDRNLVEGFIAKITLQKIYRTELGMVADLVENLSEPLAYDEMQSA